jgi:peptide/nickel transport system permease protein
MSAGGSLRTYLITRLLLTVPMVLILLTMVFILMRVAPGDPIQSALGGRAPAEVIAQKRAEAGFDRPLIVQYAEYLGQVATGNFGRALTDNRPVTSIIVQNGAATGELAVAALLIAAVIGVPLGLLAGRRRDGPFDVTIRLSSIVTYAAPTFFLGLLLQLLCGKFLPTSGSASGVVLATTPEVTHVVLIDALIAGDGPAATDALMHLILPALTLGVVTAGVFARLVRVNIIQTLRADYVEAASARGIPPRRVVIHHAFRNALVPVVTVMGLQAALLLSGAVLTENTFNWPGIGQALLHYLNNRDYVAVQGIITAFALVVVVVSLIIDVVTVIVDPRVKY